VLALFMTISGPLETLNIKGTLGKGSTVEAIGPNGRIGNITVKKNVNGTIHAVQSIGTITIGGNLNGNVKVDAFLRGGMALRKLQVGGTIANGALTIGASNVVANVGDIIVGKGLGKSPADTLTISGSLNRLQVGGPLNSTLKIGRTIGTLQANQVNGAVTAGADLTNLNIKRGGLRGALTVGNQLKNANIVGGVSANVSANNGIGTLTVANGNVAPGVTIRSEFGGINTLRVARGDLDGSVISSGKIGQIIVGRNVGDGTTPLTISGTRLGLLQVGGSIRKNVTIQINGPIDSLIVGNNIDEGAIIQASALHKQKIGGQVFGSLLIG